jgi:hypothetical protein
MSAGASGSNKRDADETPGKNAALDEEKRIRDVERKLASNQSLEVNDLAVLLKGWMVTTRNELTNVQEGQAAISSKLDSGLSGVNRKLGDLERKQAAAEAAQAVMQTEMQKLQQQLDRMRSGSGASTSAAAVAAAGTAGREALVDETTIFADVVTEEIVAAPEAERSSRLIQLIESVAAANGMFVRLGGATAWQPRAGSQRPAGAATARGIRFNVSVPPGMRKELLVRVGRALNERGVSLRDRRTTAGQKLFTERLPIFNFIKQQGGKAFWRNGVDIWGTRPGGGDGEGLLTAEEVGKWAEIRAAAMQ